ncbi:MAG: class I SAM-dependent methyltransferase [Polynucleobacter sp.]
MDPLNLKTVAEHWGSDASTVGYYGNGYHWVEHPQVLAYIHEQMSGHAGMSWDFHFWKRYIEPQKRGLKVLSLGCGCGNLEISLMKRGGISELIAYDIADGALDVAKKAAIQADVKIEFCKANLNELVLPVDSFDVVVASSSLHHVEMLEPLFFQIYRSLRRGGLMAINEYIGPSRFQFAPYQVDLINYLHGLLPDRYRWRRSDPAVLKVAIDFPSVEFLQLHDPSEAIRSDEIVPLLKNYFKVVEDRPFGGTLLHFLLQDIAGNFDPSCSHDCLLMNLLIYSERSLIDAAALSSDFTYMVLAK